ncbi:YncE family protein [Comamonas guangdongensis]|uniref:YncE family protein n=1 Tax=Comamonas guangdongensis TaxID=510515 RepID=UPI0034E2F52D
MLGPTTCAAGVALTLAAATATASSTNNVRILMQPEPGADYIQGRYYLIPQPYATVKGSLEQGFATASGLRGFQLRDDTAALSDMEFYWVQVGARHLPALREALAVKAGAQAVPVLDRALKAGAITREEHIAFRDAIVSQQDYADDTLKAVPFVAQPIARWSFHRTQGKSRAQQIDYGTVMDISSLVDRPPLTLVWYGGTASTVTRKLKLMSCMVGVTCIPNPHIEHNTRAAEHLDPALASYLDGLASRMQALAPAGASHVMQAYFDAYARSAPRLAPATLQASAATPARLPAVALPADESELRRRDNGDWNLLALPDGSLLASGAAAHRYVSHGDSVQRQAVDGLNGTRGLKIDPEGLVWGLATGEEGAPRLLAWRPGGKPASYAPAPGVQAWRINNWTIRAGGGVALRLDDQMYALTPQGRWNQRKWNAEPRRAASDAVEHALPWIYSPAIHFGDGLFWAADRDGYGIDPDTARVSRSIKTSTDRLFFGSHAGGWALAPATDAEGAQIFRIINLANGQQRFNLATPAAYYTSSMARSAHGRLLAISGGESAVTVINMKSGQIALNLRVSTNHSVSAMAFSWKGDKLWIYASAQGNGPPSELTAWDVPADLIDGAEGRNIPDQLRCGSSMECK